MQVPTCILDGHLHRLTYTRCRTDKIDSPDDEHRVGRNTWRVEINVQKKNCASSWLFTRIIDYRTAELLFHVKCFVCPC